LEHGDHSRVLSRDLSCRFPILVLDGLIEILATLLKRGSRLINKCRYDVQSCTDSLRRHTKHRRPCCWRLCHLSYGSSRRVCFPHLSQQVFHALSEVLECAFDYVSRIGRKI